VILRAWWMLSFSQIHHDLRGLRERPEQLGRPGGEVRRASAAQQVHPRPGAHLECSEHGDLPVRVFSCPE
jgi:hypothetical protein